MADIIKISDATALALHSLIYLASRKEGQSTTAEIAEVFDASRHHLAKVHQRLSSAGFIFSQRGPMGGVGLSRDPAQTTLLEVYEAMEGPLERFPCLFNREVCVHDNCVLSGLLPDLTRQVRDYFKQTTLAQLADKSTWETDRK